MSVLKAVVETLAESRVRKDNNPGELEQNNVGNDKSLDRSLGGVVSGDIEKQELELPFHR